MHKTAEVTYLTLPVDSANEGLSLVEYLHRHGVEAAPEGPDAVSIPIVGSEQTSQMTLIHDLCDGWRLYWDHFDAELFGLPVFVRDHSEGDHCPSCGAGPVVG